MEPAIVEYRWTFVAPEWVVEPRNVDVRAVISSTWTKRIDYGTLEFPIEHRAIARIPEFRCKYPDFGLPNECRTTWRTVYADVPVAVIRRDHDSPWRRSFGVQPFARRLARYLDLPALRQ